MKKVSIFFSIKKTRKVTNDNKNNINKCTIQALAFWRSKLYDKQSKRCIPKNNLQGPQITVCQSS